MTTHLRLCPLSRMLRAEPIQPVTFPYGLDSNGDPKSLGEITLESGCLVGGSSFEGMIIVRNPEEQVVLLQLKKTGDSAKLAAGTVIFFQRIDD